MITVLLGRFVCPASIDYVLLYSSCVWSISRTYGKLIDVGMDGWQAFVRVGTAVVVEYATLGVLSCGMRPSAVFFTFVWC